MQHLELSNELKRKTFLTYKSVLLEKMNWSIFPSFYSFSNPKTSGFSNWEGRAAFINLKCIKTRNY